MHEWLLRDVAHIAAVVKGMREHAQVIEVPTPERPLKRAALLARRAGVNLLTNCRGPYQF